TTFFRLLRIFCDKNTDPFKTLRKGRQESADTPVRAKDNPQSGREIKDLIQPRAGNRQTNAESRGRKKFGRAQKICTRPPEK
ncbi:hypothetical protein PV773_05780, partial [Mesorhizobium sp. CC13]|uniref:hypothetical protein n=1 Tax=Mesorhizobium sp. CC13 TaxID=3029194 RepID=UPI0032663009